MLGPWEMGRSMGRGMREFKESLTGNDSDSDLALNAGEPAPEQHAPTLHSG